MIDIDFNKAIYDRLLGDTGTGGLFAVGSELVNGIRVNQLTPGTERPYILINTVSETAQDEGFTHDGHLVTTQVTVYTNPRDGGLEAMRAILRRIYGDAVEQSDNLPTYGLMRWKPDISASGWDANPIEFESQNQVQQDADVLQRALTLSCWITKG